MSAAEDLRRGGADLTVGRRPSPAVATCTHRLHDVANEECPRCEGSGEVLDHTPTAHPRLPLLDETTAWRGERALMRVLAPRRHPRALYVAQTLAGFWTSETRDRLDPLRLAESYVNDGPVARALCDVWVKALRETAHVVRFQVELHGDRYGRGERAMRRAAEIEVEAKRFEGALHGARGETAK